MHPIVQYLDALATESDPSALVLLNLGDSCEAGLVPPDTVAEFLTLCAQRLAAAPDQGAAAALSWVAETSLADAGHRFLRLCKQTGLEPSPKRLSHVTTYSTFIGHHVRKRLPAVDMVVPAVPPPAQASRRSQLHQDLARLVAAPGWSAEHATLGRPHPHPNNCWVSSDEFADSRLAPAYDDRSSPADRVRDVLGLIDLGAADVHLVRYEFDAAASFDRLEFDMARPSFADGGNRRFRVQPTCERGEAMAAAGWGSTVDLARVGDPALHPLTGRPERVTEALPIAALAGLSVEYLGSTSVVRGDSVQDDDARFLAVTLGEQARADLAGRVRLYLGL